MKNMLGIMMALFIVTMLVVLSAIIGSIIQEPEMKVAHTKQVEILTVENTTINHTPHYFIGYVENGEYKTDYLRAMDTKILLKKDKKEAVLKELEPESAFYRLFGDLFEKEENILTVDRSVFKFTD